MEELNMSFQEIAEMIAEYKGISPDEIKPETAFADLELDSLDTVDLAMKFEEKYNVTLELTEGIKTVGDLAGIIEKALAENKP
jgi:acyl carrier protein